MVDKLYQEISNTLCASNARYRCVLTPEVVQDFAGTIQNRELFVYFRECHSDISQSVCSAIFHQVATLLYSDCEIEEYFTDCILQLQDNQATWMPPSLSALYRAIFGAQYQHSRRTNETSIEARFVVAYERCMEMPAMFTSSLYNHVLRLVHARESLAECCGIFTQHYKCNLVGSFPSYINQYVLPTLGDTEWESYCADMAQKLYNAQPVITIQNFNLDVLRSNIFGCTWNFQLGPNDMHKDVEFTALRAWFPLVIHTYRDKTKREYYYTLLQYDAETICALEAKVAAFDSENYRVHPVDVVEYSYIGSIPASEYLEEMRNIIMSSAQSARCIPNFGDTISTVNQSERFASLSAGDQSSQRLAFLHKHYNSFALDAKKMMFELNKQEYTKPVWILYFPQADVYKCVTIDFSKVPSCKLRADLKSYIWEYLYDERTTNSAKSQIQTRIIRCFEFLTEKYRVRLMSEIEEWMILSYLSELDTEYHLSPSSIASVLSALKTMFSTLDMPNNPAVNIRVGHLQDHREPTHIIPDDILVFLDNNIHRMKQEDCALIYRIASVTGWRFSEIRNLTVNGVSYRESDEFAFLSTIISKTKSSRMQHLYGDAIEDAIPVELYRDLMHYIDSTAQMRRQIGSNQVFFRTQHGTAAPLTSGYYNRALNAFLRQNNIKSIDETYSDFSAMQTRKTVASGLINNGASSADVQKKLGHITQSTTNRYYLEVQRKKLADLNHEFYRAKFDVYMDEEKLKLFTEEERKILYVDFCLGKRQVELGECSKHPSEGRCASLGYTSCAKCPKLCTGKKYLPRWETLLNDSAALLQMFVDEYAKYGISHDEYCQYIEYRQEKELHDYYLAVVERLRKEK